jgi:hypothetical protein
MHYGGTGYDNTAGLGVQLVPASQLGLQLSLPELPSLTELPVPGNAELLLLPVTMLYDRGQTVLPSAVLHERLAHASIILNPATAARAGLSEAPAVLLTLAGLEYQAAIVLDEKIPEGAALLPRSLGLPVHSPQVAAVKAAQPVGVGG